MQILAQMEEKKKKVLGEQNRKVENSKRKSGETDFPSVVIMQSDTARVDDELFLTRKPLFVLIDDLNW